MKRVIYIFIVFLLLIFILIFKFANMGNMQKFLTSKIENVVANTSVGYYLSEEKILFCPSYNVDAGEFVPTNNDKIVAYNVKTFGKNFLINKNNELYIWGNYDSYKYISNFKDRKKINLIAKDVREALCKNNYVAYIDINDDLWVVGNVNKKQYHSFTKIKSSIKKIVDINGDLAYIDMDGKLYQNGGIIFQNMNLKEASFNGEQIVLLTENNELYFCGVLTDTYISNTTSEMSKILLNVNKEMPLKLKDDIVKISTDNNIIAAIDEQGQAYIWGYFYNNGDDNYSIREVKDFYGYKIADNIKDIFVSTYTIIMIDNNGKTFAYGTNDSLSGIGNSIDTSKEYIGLNSTELIEWQ